MTSAELSLLRSPRHGYASLVTRSSQLSWPAALRRPLLVAVVLGATMVTTATNIVDLGMLARTTLVWSWVTVVQGLGAAVLLASGRHRVSAARAFDLLFAANAPWTLWMVALTAWTGMTSPIGRLQHLLFPSTVIPGAYAAWILYGFCREVLGDTRGPAIRKVLLHQAAMWGIGILYFAWAVQVWPRAVGIWREFQTGAVQPAASDSTPLSMRNGLPAMLTTSDGSGATGGETILAADFHVHTAPGDGALMPSDWAREAKRRGLDAIAITGHNTMLALDLVTPIGPPAGAIVIRGEEITTPFYHLAAVGLEHTVDWNQPLEAIVEAVHAQHGAVIAAHPADAQRAPWTDSALRLVDGIEAAHPMAFARQSDWDDFHDAWDHARRAHPAIAPIGSSDEHSAQPIGLCRTYVFVHEVSAAGVVDAIRRGRTVACDARGAVIGDPSLTRQVEATCRAAAEPVAATSGQRVVTAIVWIALMGLTLLSFA